MLEVQNQGAAVRAHSGVQLALEFVDVAAVDAATEYRNRDTSWRSQVTSIPALKAAFACVRPCPAEVQ